MSRNWIVAATILYLAASGIFLSAWFRSEKKHEPSVAGVSEKSPTPPSRKALVPPSQKDYSYIAKNNLFHPRRGKAEEETRPAAKKPGPPVRLKLDLRGVFRSGDKSGALIVVAGNTPHSGKDLKKADAEIFFTGAEIAEGYILQEVGSNSATILHDGEKIIVALEKLKQPEMSSEKEENKPKDKDNVPGRSK